MWKWLLQEFAHSTGMSITVRRSEVLCRENRAKFVGSGMDEQIADFTNTRFLTQRHFKPYRGVCCAEFFIPKCVTSSWRCLQ